MTVGLNVRARLDGVEQAISAFVLGRVKVEILAATRALCCCPSGLGQQVRIDQKRFAVHLKPSPLQG